MKQLTKDMIDTIRYGTESRRWEFKPPMTWNKSQKKRKSELTRAALALSNISGGGFIVIGISQQRDRSNGIKFERRGLTTKQFSSFDNPDDIARFLNARSSQPIKFEIYGGDVKFETKSKKFVVIQISESKSFIPVICIQDFKPNERHCRLVKDTIYIRTMSDPIESRGISTKEEWEEMILRLLTHKEEILHKDLMTICKNILSKAKPKPRKKITKKSEKEYERFLKRDKL
jgi:hypothetical protein